MPSSVPKGRPGGLALWWNLAVIYVIWGSTYFAIAIAIESMPPFLMATFRFAIAGVILVAWDLLRHPETRRLPTRREVVDSFIVGGLLLGIGNGFVTYGELTVPSGIAAILIGMMPLWFALLGWLYLRERLPRVVAFAVALGFAGVALLVWPSGDGANSFDPLGIAILFLAPLGWAHGSIYSVRRAKLPRSPMTASGFQMLAGAAVTGVEALIIGEPSRFDPAGVTSESLIAVLYLIVFGSMLAYSAYAWLLRNAPLSLVGTYAYVNPVVAVALGTVFLAEPISARTVFAAAVILVAVAIIVTTRGRMAGAGSGDPAAGEEPEPRPTPAGAAASVSSAPAASSAVSVAASPRAPSG